MRTRTTIFMMAVALLAASVTSAQNVTYDVDRSADFASFRTYAWVPGTPVPDAFNHQRIVAAVDMQLAAKGLRLVAINRADVLVAYHASFDRDLQITGFSSGWGGYRFPGSRVGTARTEEILTGTLIVDVIDADSRTIAWRAIAVKDIDVQAKPEKREKNIVRAVDRLFHYYPSGRAATR